MYINILFAYLFNFIMTSLIHFTACYRATNGKVDIIYTTFLSKVINETDTKRVFTTYLKFLFSMDYWSAYSMKTNFNGKRILADFVKKSNSYNLFLSGILIVIYIILKPVNNFFKYFIFIRAISRSFEIMFAFYKDVISKSDKNSDLKATDRLRLATKSYFEIIITYTLVYSLINQFESRIVSMINLGSNIFQSIGISTLTNVSFEKFQDISIEKVHYIKIFKSFMIESYIIEYIFISIQLFTSLCLVYFALARYIGEKESN